MTDLRQAAQAVVDRWDSLSWSWSEKTPTADLIAALRKALEQPEQEPVAWAVQGCSKMWRGEFAEIDAKAEAKRIGGTCVAYALYTTPPAAQRPWRELTMDELATFVVKTVGYPIKLAESIEAKLKERNT